VQLFGEAAKQKCLKMGTLGCMDGCSGDGDAFILHVACQRPSEETVEDVQANGLVVHGTPTVGLFPFPSTDLSAYSLQVEYTRQ